MGAVGGGVWHLVKGLRNSPQGYRFRGAIEVRCLALRHSKTQSLIAYSAHAGDAKVNHSDGPPPLISLFQSLTLIFIIRRESPKLGGSFANWGLTFSLFDCSLQFVRKKEDPWNAIGAGFMTGGFLQLRSGLKSAARSAAVGGLLLAMIEGLGITLQRLMSPPPPGINQPGMGAPGVGPLPGGPLEASSSAGGQEAGGGMFSWMGFGSGGESKSSSGSSEVQLLTEDPFTPPPMPTEFVHDGQGDGKH